MITEANVKKWHTLGIAFAIFLFIFITLGFPFSHWWFNGCDDFHGLYLGFRTKTWRELFYFFIDGHINQDSGPSNGHYNEPTAFFSTYYRPLYCVYLTLQYWLFGTNAYRYFLCNVFFHAFNSALLFIIFSSLITYLPALLGSLFFAFHPQIAYRFGAIVNLHYYINVALILITILLYKNFLDTHRWWMYVVACFTFMLALFTRESSIVFPAILILGTWYYTQSFRSLSITGGFWFIALGFLATRLYLYPLNTSTQWFIPNNVSIGAWLMLMKKIPEFLVLGYDCCGLSWLPWGHKILRGMLLLSCISLCVWLFAHNTKRLAIILLMFSATLMLWPAYVGCYSPRYIYEALPFIIAAYLLCFTGYVGPGSGYKKYTIFFFVPLVTFYIGFTLINFKRRESKMHTVACALQDLVANPATQNRALCLLSYPMDGMGDHPADIIRVLRNNVTLPILCDSAGALVQIDSNIVVSTSWSNLTSKYYTTNYASVTAVDGGFVFKTSNPEKIHFFVSPGQSYSLGKKVINEIKNNRVTDVTLYLDKKYQDLYPVFVVWNYEKGRFEVLEL